MKKGKTLAYGEKKNDHHPPAFGDVPEILPAINPILDDMLTLKKHHVVSPIHRPAQWHPAMEGLQLALR